MENVTIEGRGFDHSFVLLPLPSPCCKQYISGFVPTVNPRISPPGGLFIFDILRRGLIRGGAYTRGGGLIKLF